MKGVSVRQSFAISAIVTAGISLVAAALLLLCAEVTLRFLGMGESEMSQLPYQEIYLPVMTKGEREDGVAVWSTGDGRLPYQSILVRKPENSLRVFVYGASATYALGFSTNASFAAQLGHMLRDAYPDHSLEVVNFGIPAIPASNVKILLEDTTRRYNPDLLVVYSGNNEFMEIHAEKYMENERSMLMRLRRFAVSLRISRVTDQVLRGNEIRTLEEHNASRADVRQVEHTIIQHMSITEDEIRGILNEYERHLNEMVLASQSTNTPLLIMTVASNWRWRGINDLPQNWIDELMSNVAGPDRERYLEAAEKLTTLLDAGGTKESQQDNYYKRGVLHELLEKYDAAAADLIAAKDVDPHLRRALEDGNSRVRLVAEENSVPIVDTVSFLRWHGHNGIIGHEEIYDNVHFTPRGALLVAGEIFRVAQAEGMIPAPIGFDVDSYVKRRLDDLTSMEGDELSVDEFLGIGHDRIQILLRDPFKYDKLLVDLDQRIIDNPADVTSLIYRGNIHYYDMDGADLAERDYRAALRVDPEQEDARNNLDLLLASNR